MLTNEIMGVLALGILWVNLALIAADALLRARDLGRLAARLRGNLLEATAEATLARFVVEQTGRHGSADHEGVSTIRFHDRAYRSELLGGLARVGGRALELPTATGEVWVGRDELARAGGFASDAAFDAAYGEARKAKGLHREVVVEVAPDARVWLHAEAGEALTWREPALISTVEPLAWLAGARVKLFGFVAALLVLGGACTALALVPPVFGLASTLGGAACLALFLLAQPAGTAVRDLCKHPSEQPVRGLWVRGRAPARAAAAG